MLDNLNPYLTDWTATARNDADGYTITHLAMTFGALRISVRLTDTDRLRLIALLTGAINDAAFTVVDVHLPPVKANQKGYAVVDMDMLKLRKVIA